MNEVVSILSMAEESHDTKTFEFQWEEKAKPGQFVMIWVPGMNEVPMSLSKVSRVKGITVKCIGEDTAKIHALGVGSKVHVRGPFGRGFDLNVSQRALIVGGGVGMAAMLPVIKETGADVIVAARSASEIILDDAASKYSENVWIATDDGSRGFHGNAVQLMKQRMSEKDYDMVMACGPEVMLHYVYQHCCEAGIDCQLSLERYMKCGAGVCGSCAIDGQRVCKDGPVFTKEEIASLSDFGLIKRDSCGCKVNMR